MVQSAYKQALDWIHSIGRFGMKPGLERIRALLERLDNPQHRLQFLHIGGSNGKGSTAVMAASVLQESGYRVGLYTSPYIIAFSNRMSINGEDIPPDELVELVDRVRPLVEELEREPGPGALSQFEVVTALALLFFARHRPDLVVLEVGLGGRLDATNVVTPLLSVITNISLEHTGVLGDTVEAIAREKAGIIKPGVPLLTAARDPSALSVIAGVCRERGAPLYRVITPGDEPFRENNEREATFASGRITPEGQYFSYYGFARRWEDLFIPLRGRYQLSNAATALASLELLERYGFAVGEEALRRGLEKTFWPGRLERLQEKPLLIMDGAHNPAGMKELAAALPVYFRYRRLVLVLGILSDKDYNAMLASILPLADTLVLTRPQIDRAADLEILAAAAGRYFDGPVLKEEDVGPALRKALEQAGAEDAVLVTGSLYTVSEARAAWLAGRRAGDITSLPKILGPGGYSPGRG